MRAAEKTRIICIDDSKETRDLFCLLLDGHRTIDNVASLCDTTNLEGTLARLRPDVVVLDRWIPGEESLEAMARALAEFPEVRFLILSSDDDPDQVALAFEKGASGYAVKDGNLEAFLDAIQEVAAGETVRPRPGIRFNA